MVFPRLNMFIEGLLLMIVMRPTFVRTSPVILTQYRSMTTESVPEAEAGSIIAAQRKNRPISPHLSIYKPQIPWVLSSLNRITGALLSGGASQSPFHTSLGKYPFEWRCFVIKEADL